jgi:SSS family solute:Na+ symporter
MSTVDSYTLIAAGNVTYDAWPALTGRSLDDRTLLRSTRLLTIVTLAVAIVLALRFERLRDAWIFMATILVSTALVPMLAALFLPRRPPPLAGQLGAAAGLIAALALFVAVEAFGVELAEEETRAIVWPFVSWRMTREEAMLVTVPLSLLAFLAGMFGKRAEDAR